jgi:TatD DNase family protein
MHAHIDVTIAPAELEDLRSVIFAVTRSLQEAQQAIRRSDGTTVWGVGCHPGVARAQKDFSPDHFADTVESTAFVGEVGLDGKSRVPMTKQRDTFRSALEVLTTMPRLVSLHSYAATEALVEDLEASPIRGAILHWWLGDAALTARAVELGCYFSVNASSVRRTELMALIPSERLLTETDHPFGDRRSTGLSAPGNVESVERSVARLHAISAADARLLTWRNLNRAVREVGCSQLLPRQVRSWLAVTA